MRNLLNTTPDTPFNTINDVINRLATDIIKKKEQLLKERMDVHNLPWTEDFIKEHISCIVREGDSFDHFWFNFGKPDAIRLLSIERESVMPDIINEDFSYKMKAEYRYY